MFRKPFKIKSNNQLKASDRKAFKEKLLHSFSNLTESDFDAFVSKKDVISIVKLITATNEVVQVYTVQKTPVVFEVKGLLVPTIFFLWKFPDLIPVFTVHSQVLNFLTSGADLMLPGVVTPPTNTGLPKYGNVAAEAPAYVNCTDNKAAVAVGIAAQNSSQMIAASGRGKCLTVYHLLGDKLCSLDGVALHVPNHGPPDWLKLTSYDEDFPALGAPQPQPRYIAADEEINVVEDAETDTSIEKTEIATITAEQMDKLLNYCFFVATKYSKTLTLPILTSNFYKLQMLPVCPQGQSLDIKKTSYKKLKQFLDQMCKDGLITVKEMKKGVESITAINKEHPKFAEFYIEPNLRPRKEDSAPTSSTNVTESYILTPSVLPIFAGFNKGDVVQMSQIRHCVTDYVKRNNCQNEENTRLVKPNEVLMKVCKTDNSITWEELIEKVCESMKSCYKVTSGYEELVNKGKVSPISLTVSQRSGNKKVTLIDNLELFGVNINEFAKECQHGVSASTSISRPPGKKCDQLLVQGNQVLFVYNLLTEKYKIPKRYVTGLENAPNKKKK